MQKKKKYNNQTRLHEHTHSINCDWFSSWLTSQFSKPNFDSKRFPRSSLSPALVLIAVNKPTNAMFTVHYPLCVFVCVCVPNKVLCQHTHITQSRGHSHSIYSNINGFFFGGFYSSFVIFSTFQVHWNSISLTHSIATRVRSICMQSVAVAYDLQRVHHLWFVLNYSFIYLRYDNGSNDGGKRQQRLAFGTQLAIIISFKMHTVYTIHLFTVLLFVMIFFLPRFSVCVFKSVNNPMFSIW